SHGVKVFRIQDRVRKKEQSKASYLWPLLRFLVGAMAWVTRRHHRQPYDLIHVHNIPDFLVFAACYPKLSCANVILNIHDILPEFFAIKFGASSSSSLVSCLKWMERISGAFADHVIIANHLWLDKYVERSAHKNKCSVVLNHVDRRLFKPK